MEVHYFSGSLAEDDVAPPPDPSFPPINYLDRLPTELWDKILRMCWNGPLSRPELKSLPRICSFFRDILDPVRFSRLTLSASDFSEGPSVCKLADLETRPIRFAYVKHLRIHSHKPLFTKGGNPTSYSSTQPQLTLLISDFLCRPPPNQLCNVESLQIVKCTIDMILVNAIRSLPKLTVLTLDVVAVEQLPVSLGVALFRLTELRFFQVMSSKKDLITLVSALSNPFLRFLGLVKQAIPGGLFHAVSLAVSPCTITTLVIEGSHHERSELLEFLESQPTIHHFTYSGELSFRSLPSSALPCLKRCFLSGTEIEHVVPGRPLMDVTTYVYDHPSAPASVMAITVLSALAQSTKHIQKLMLTVNEFHLPLFEAMVAKVPKLKELDVISMQAVRNDMVESLISRIGALHSLKSIAFSKAGTGPWLMIKPPLAFYRTSDGKADLQWQHDRVKEMEARCMNLLVVTMRPISWIRLRAGEWRSYCWGQALWDRPLQEILLAGENEDLE